MVKSMEEKMNNAIVLPISFFAFALLWPADAFSEPLGTAVSSAYSYVSLAGDNNVSGEGQLSSSNSNSFEFWGINYSGNSNAQTLNVGQNTFANSETNVSIDSCPSGNCKGNAITGKASSGFTYRSGIVLKMGMEGMPSIGQIPVQVTGSLFLSASISGGDSSADKAGASAALEILSASTSIPYPSMGSISTGNGGVSKVFFTNTMIVQSSDAPQTSTTQINESILLGMDEFLEVSLSSNVSTTVWGKIGTSATASASADPVFSFDQQAFDLIMGEDTFILANYLDFKYSEQTYATPVPGAVWLLGSGLIWMAGLRRKGKIKLAPQ